MSEELKPCPFCGEIPRVLIYTAGAKYIDHDCLGIDKHSTAMIKIEDWQKRPIEDALRARIAELEESNLLLILYYHDAMESLHELKGIPSAPKHKTLPDNNKCVECGEPIPGEETLCSACASWEDYHESEETE